MERAGFGGAAGVVLGIERHGEVGLAGDLHAVRAVAHRLRPFRHDVVHDARDVVDDEQRPPADDAIVLQRKAERQAIIAAREARNEAKARAALEQAVREEAEIIQPLRKQPYGAWEFEVRDPNGYVLVFSELDQGFFLT